MIQPNVLNAMEELYQKMAAYGYITGEKRVYLRSEMKADLGLGETVTLGGTAVPVVVDDRIPAVEQPGDAFISDIWITAYAPEEQDDNLK